MENPVFYFDFGSPNAYLACRVLPGIDGLTILKTIRGVGIAASSAQK